METQDRGGIAARQQATPGRLYDGPDAHPGERGTASASEILAGALQDSGRSRLAGSRTFGKGLIQTLINLSDGSGLAVTVARYLTPSGRDIQNQGIEPDVQLPQPEPLEPDGAGDTWLQDGASLLTARLPAGCLRPMSQRTYHDPLHGAIRLDRQDPAEALAIDLIDTAPFQRLRRIRQLGPAFLTFHGAESSRFTHSLGVLAVARMALEAAGAARPRPGPAPRRSVCRRPAPRCGPRAPEPLGRRDVRPAARELVGATDPRPSGPARPAR